MTAQRRLLLRGTLASAALAALPVARAAAAPDTGRAFAATTFADAIAALGGTPTPHPQIQLDTPQIAENGALVPITVTSALLGTREIVLLVEGNPQPLAVAFDIPAGTEPFVATRLRMAASSTVYAAVRTDDGFYAAARAVDVTVGGCGEERAR
jgi:sulfur-oxidizing protein SoxY